VGLVGRISFFIAQQSKALSGNAKLVLNAGLRYRATLDNLTQPTNNAPNFIGANH